MTLRFSQGPIVLGFLHISIVLQLLLVLLGPMLRSFYMIFFILGRTIAKVKLHGNA